MKKFKAILIIFFNILTILILNYFILARFRVRLPKDIFINPSFFNGILYLIFLLSNILLCVILYFQYKKEKDSVMSYISIQTFNWINDSYMKLMDFIANRKHPIDLIIAYITNYYVKIPIIILQMLIYIPKICLILAISVDVFYFKRFEYSYYTLYLLLFTLLAKAMKESIKLSITFQISIRLYYIIIFGYIVYFYPIPVIIMIATLLYNIITFYIGFNVLKWFIAPIFIYIIKKIK